MPAVELIDRQIAEDEILVRFLFTNDLKKSQRPVSFENIDSQNVFFDTRGGVSLARYIYDSEEMCKQRASQNIHKCIGFAIFKKTHFDQTVHENKQVRPTFECEIKGTPLDIDGNYITADVDVPIGAEGHPGHADIFYINPGAVDSNEKPNTATRAFSRAHFKNSQIILINESPLEPGCFANLLG